MRATRFRRGNETEGDFQYYRRIMAEDNSERRKRMKSAVKTALEQELTEKQRTALFLYYFEEMTMQEIAEKLGVCRSTVSRNIARAKQRIEKCAKYSL